MRVRSCKEKPPHAGQMQRPEPCREWKCQELTVPTGRAAPLRHSRPLGSSCVSLNATGEECWSLPQGYTEVSEVSAAVWWGEDAATRRQHHRLSVPGVFVI